MLYETLIYLNFCLFFAKNYYSTTLLSRSTLNFSLEIVCFMKRDLLKGYKDKKSLRCTIKPESGSKIRLLYKANTLKSIDLLKPYI